MSKMIFLFIYEKEIYTKIIFIKYMKKSIYKKDTKKEKKTNNKSTKTILPLFYNNNC